MVYGKCWRVYEIQTLFFVVNLIKMLALICQGSTFVRFCDQVDRLKLHVYFLANNVFCVYLIEIGILFHFLAVWMQITTKLKPIWTRERLVCSCFKESEKERCLLMETLRSKMVNFTPPLVTWFVFLLSQLFHDQVLSFSRPSGLFCWFKVWKFSVSFAKI